VGQYEIFGTELHCQEALSLKGKN